jgi:hypothetical protein
MTGVFFNFLNEQEQEKSVGGIEMYIATFTYFNHCVTFSVNYCCLNFLKLGQFSRNVVLCEWNFCLLRQHQLTNIYTK